MNIEEESIIYSQGRISEFISKYPGQICNNFDRSKVKCGIIKTNELEIAAQLILQGSLVAFPTETVYGLGANALNEEAVKSIFTTKKRPLTDPVIMHLSDSSEIYRYVDDGQDISFGKQFWPGPFTLILKANQKELKTTQVLSADTGFVGFRIPDNSIALQLIRIAKVPIAAPSANLFAHVSPTSPIHVFNDFYDQKIHIIDGDISENGIESTVVKIENGEVKVLRRGSLDISSLTRNLDKFTQYQKVTVSQKIVDESESTEAPGQFLKHYAPYIPTYILNFQENLNLGDALSQKFLIIDFNHYAIDNIKNQDIIFRTLSESGDLKEAMHNFYDTLRWAENQDVEIILITDIRAVCQDKNDHSSTLFDKIYRSASGQYVSYDKTNQIFCKQ